MTPGSEKRKSHESASSTAAKVPYSTPDPETAERERPEIRNVEDFWCWLNTWGDERKRGLSPGSQYDQGYRRCIRDAMRALEAAGVTFDTVPDEAWSRWTGL